MRALTAFLPRLAAVMLAAGTSGAAMAATAATVPASPSATFPPSLPAPSVSTFQLTRDGLVLMSADGRQLDRLDARVKRWDQRHAADGAPVAVAQDADSGALLLLQARGGRLHVAARWSAPSFAPEQLCLYRDGQGLLQVFLLGEDGLSEQWWLPEPPTASRPSSGATTAGAGVDRRAPTAPALLRRLATGHDPAACRVRDEEDALYVAEPGVGLWRHAADAEREGRRLVLADATSDEEALARRLTQWLSEHPAQTVTRLPFVLPTAQTRPVRGHGDAADDPALWVDARRPGRSLILATDKKRGLAVNDLQGRERQFLPVGRVNNVDLRQGLRYGGQRWDLAVATQRDERALVLFAIAPSGRVREIARLPTPLEDIYGVCVGRNAQGGLDLFPNDKDGRILHLRLEHARGTWQARTLRTLRLDSQPEGCVVDERRAQLFVGEEKRGVWRLDLNPGADATPVLAIPVGEHLVADVEGLALHDGPRGRRLVVSSQGDDSYAVFDADAPHRWLGSLRIGMDPARGLDGASETDGLEVSSADLGGPYREGLLVVQDGRKRLPPGPQNFKLVPWSSVERVLRR